MDLFYIFEERENKKYLSTSKLKKCFTEYEQEIQETISRLSKNYPITSDQFSDEFFSTIQEHELVSFEHGNHSVTLKMGCYRVEDTLDNVTFEPHYSIDIRNKKNEQVDHHEFKIGQENELLHTFSTLGFTPS